MADCLFNSSIAMLSAALAMSASCRGASEVQAEGAKPVDESAGAQPPGPTYRTLPAARTQGAVSLEEALARRRSERSFGSDALADTQIAQLAWAAQGITAPSSGARTAPSAGALYPLSVYLLDGLGVWRYDAAKHRLVRVSSTDRRATLARAALGQGHVGAAAADFVLAGKPAITRAKYGSRAERYVYLEAGHAAQNMLLQATALKLAAVVVGAFDDDDVREVVGMPKAEIPLTIICVGQPPGAGR